MEQEVIFNLNKYMDSLSLESYDPREYVLNSEDYAYSVEWIKSITEEEFKSKKGEIEKALSEMYDRAVKSKKDCIDKYLEKNSKLDDLKTNIRKAIEDSIKVVDKSKFIKEMMKRLTEGEKIKKGIEIMDFDIVKIKNVLAQDKVLDLIRFILIFFSSIQIIAYVFTMNKGITGLLGSTDKMRATNNSEAEKYFLIRWNGFTKSAILARLTNGIGFQKMSLTIEPKIRIKINKSENK